MMVVDCNTCRMYVKQHWFTGVYVNHQTDQHSTVCWEFSAHLDEVYTCELGLGGSFAPKPGAAERYKVLVVLFSRMPPNIPQTLNQEFGGLGRAGLCQRYVGAFLQSNLLMYRYNGLPFTHRRCLKLPKVNGIAGSGCSSGKAGGDDWTYGGSFPGIMASKIWAETMASTKSDWLDSLVPFDMQWIPG